MESLRRVARVGIAAGWRVVANNRIGLVNDTIVVGRPRGKVGGGNGWTVYGITEKERRVGTDSIESRS